VGGTSLVINSVNGGNLLVGTTTASTSTQTGFAFLSPTSQGTYQIIGHSNGSGTGTSYLIFTYNGSSIGSITQNGTTGVLYNLTSDYRLKNNQQPLTGAKDFVMA
jgi:hypothetical protein